MSMPRLGIALVTLALAAGAATAGPPRVAADIGPVAGLVDRVMAGIGAAETVLPPGASPHGYAMRPSEARALAQADIVVWIGPELTPWLERTLATLAPKAARLTLLDVPGTITLPARALEDFAGAAGGAESEHDHADGHDHDHAHGDGPDPHAWLDPVNAALWLGTIAEALAAADPANASAYRANAEAGRAELDALQAEIAATLAPVRDRRFVTYHDATQYLETRFGLSAAGTIADSDAADPSPARIAALRARLAPLAVACVFAEPQFNPGLVRAVGEGAGLRTATLDGLGSTLDPGPGSYPALLRALAADIAACLAPAG